MEFSRQEYWSGLQFLTPRDLPNPRFEPISPASSDWQVGSLQLSHLEAPQDVSCGKACNLSVIELKDMNFVHPKAIKLE